MYRQLKSGETLITNDDEFLYAAFDAWKQEHGFRDSIGLGDIDRRSLSEVLDRAQKLKMKDREKSA